MKHIKSYDYDYIKTSIVDLIMEDFEDLVWSSSVLYKRSLDKDLKEGVSEFYELLESEYGITKDNLNDWYRENKNKILKDKDLTSWCGFTDIIIYNLDKNYKLGGGNSLHEDDISAILKYEYGFHQSKYGRLYILQGFETIKEFYYDVANKLKWCFCNNDNIDSENFDKFKRLMFGNYYYNIKNDDFFDMIKDFLSIEDYKDGYKLTIDIDKIYNIYLEINEGGKFNLYKTEVLPNISISWMKSKILQDLKNFDVKETKNGIEVNICD